MSSKINEIKKYLLNLCEYLNNNYPGTSLMPSREGGKIPLYAHKDEQYNMKIFKSKGINECNHGALILLTEELIVVDIDDREMCDTFEDLIPEFKDTVICETNKGRHYYFRRTMNSKCIKDGARQMENLEIDIKTITSSGTKGIISIPPSPNKIWVRELGKYEILDMPVDFTRLYIDKTKKTLDKENKNSNINLEEVKNLLKILSDTRADNYRSWLELGWCLHNINSDILLNNWIEFSKKSTKYNIGECEKLWGTMRDEGLNLGSLHMWARVDNEYEYKRIINKRVYNDILKCGGSHNEVAAIAWKLFHGKYVCALSDGKLWYYFDNNLWKHDMSELKLRHELSTTLKDNFIIAINQLNSKLSLDDMQSNTSTTNTMKEHKSLCDKLIKIASKLQDCNFKNHLLSEMREYFYDEKFMENLDNNSNLIAFTNGVWELKKGIFRKSKPDDYLSLSVGYDYIMDVNNDYKENIENYWKMMHPNEEQRLYLKKMYSRQLYGDNGCNLFHVHAGYQGSAGNGKTSFFDIMEHCLGDYIRKFGVEFLTAKDRPEVGKAMPEYQYWKGRRILYCTEPNYDDLLNTGIMKDLTGGEKISYRLLFSNEIQEYRPKFKLHIMCNDAPQVDATDSGVKRRIRKVDYLSQFVDEINVDETNNMFKKCEGLLEEYDINPGMKMEFLRLLLNEYNHDYGFTPPKIIIDNSLMYLQENDKVYNFINEFVKINKEGYFTLKEAKDIFKKSEYNNNKLST
jgi:phage/plasmid-associated DNA primase